ncbi:MAG: hypothetical protein JXB23_14245 [Candidatus Aminicenantes bacterium]|nr:hypothetical protein [Candidatus Aminicenantes bacterium]
MKSHKNDDQVIVIDNPSGLPLLPLDEFQSFQGDFKEEIEPGKLDKLMRSILDHHVFVAKAVFFEDGVAYTEDGHQTLVALKRLRDLGYTKCRVIEYALEDGRMKPASSRDHDGIVVPYQLIVPVGETKEARCKDAARKLLQINSAYAKINPETTLLKTLDFTTDEMDDLLARISIEDFGLELYREEGDEDPQQSFEKEAGKHTNENCLYPIVPKFSEKYDAVIILSDNETDTVHLETILQIQKCQTYKEIIDHGKGMVITAGRFIELWNSR